MRSVTDRVGLASFGAAERDASGVLQGYLVGGHPQEPILGVSDFAEATPRVSVRAVTLALALCRVGSLLEAERLQRPEHCSRW